MNDNVIPFRSRPPRPANGPPHCHAVERVKKAGADRYVEAHDIQRELSSRFGFDVMLSGMPTDPDVLFALVGRLRAGLASAAGKFGDSSLRSLRGVHVFFSSEKNEIADDHGYRSLHLTNSFSAADAEGLVTLMMRGRSARH